MNKWEIACKEWLKGCPCSGPNNQEDCEECTKAFHDHLKKLAEEEGYKDINLHSFPRCTNRRRRLNEHSQF